MDEINAAVVRHLRNQKDHDETVALWEQIWERFRNEGAEGVETLLEELLECPEAVGQESKR